MSRSNKKPKLTRKFLAGQDSVLRWHTCQRIGKTYYESALTQINLEQTLEFLKGSNCLPKDLPTINVK